jgi:hypothetical protein
MLLYNDEIQNANQGSRINSTGHETANLVAVMLSIQSKDPLDDRLLPEI